MEEYERLKAEILSCTKCPLHRTRKNPVPGEGPLDAEVMIVGEAPGRREDELGRPFVGMAGKLLDALLARAGLRREEVYITNVVKCRPPGNRDPRPEEVEACLPYLVRQIALIRPRVIIALGRIAGSTLFRLAGLKWRGVKAEHGLAYNAVVAGVPVTLTATYHPASALYNPQLRRVLEEDFQGPIKEAVSSRGARARRSLDDFL
ncbi:type-4 uracil-DNA glycosylase [Stetteria hydrogenophila]